MPLHGDGLALGDVIIEDACAGTQYDHRTCSDSGGLTIGGLYGRSGLFFSLRQWCRHVRLSVFTADICGQVGSFERPTGSARGSGIILQPYAKLRESAAESVAADRGNRRVPFTASGQTLLNALLPGGSHLFEPLCGSLRSAALAPRLRIAFALLGSRLFGLVRHVARSLRLGQGFAWPLVGL
jgi:hypothetical protein